MALWHPTRPPVDRINQILRVVMFLATAAMLAWILHEALTRVI